MTELFVFIGVLIAMIIRANKEFGKIENKKIYYSHIVIMVFTVLITGLSFNVLFNLAYNFEATIQILYVQNGLFNPTMNTLIWLLISVIDVLVLFTVFNVAMRSEKARKLLVNITPILFILVAIERINDVVAKSTVETSTSLGIGLVAIVSIISYVPLFLFYKNKNIKSTIFETSDSNIKVTQSAEKA